ncbi:MAG: Ca-activated chloride channel [Candidatus Woesearchaeota archaeon]|nr:Ca-activated chloride channel [Candidatus Woesearchaeota archaeon]MDN5328168.1 Ca-activated chloride channel [Candidatus Woesearchaeota archaeon]
MVRLRKRRALYFGNIRTIEKVHGFKKFDVSYSVLFLKILLVALLFLVATDSISISKRVPLMDRDYVLVIDASPSMTKTDYPPNRLEAAKEISSEWVDFLPNSTRVGLVAFSSDIQSYVPLTLDKRKVKESIKEITIDYSKAGSSLDYALNFAYQLLSKSDKNKRVILISDGTKDVDNKTLAKAKSEGIQILAFGIGSDEDTEIINTSEIPEEFLDLYNKMQFNLTNLKRIASETNGTAYHITDKTELKEAFEKATSKETSVSIRSSYYLGILIALLSIIEFLVYGNLGAL